MRQFGDALSAPAGLLKSWAAQGARLEDKVEYRGQSIFLGDGGPHFDAKEVRAPDDPNVKDDWMDDGYYVAVFAIQIRQAFWGLPAYFELNHDENYPHAERKKLRLNAALEAAKAIIDDGIEFGIPIFRRESNIIVPRALH